MFIREYRHPHDLSGLRRCVVELQDYERRIDPGMPSGDSIADEYIKMMRGKCEQYAGKVFVSMMNDDVIGYVCVLTQYVSSELEDSDDPFAYITDLCVLESARAKGLGRALMEHARTTAVDSGASMIHVGVLAENRRARQLYEALGYAEYGVSLRLAL